MSAGHVALVLAAGGSARLGRPKQLLTRGGETLVHRAARLACGSGAQRTWVVIGAGGEAIAAALRGLPCDTIDNPDWSQGLSSSLRHAAPQVIEAALPVLVLACDQPALDAAHLSPLLEAAAGAPSECAATAYGDDPGIPAVVPAAWFADIDARAADHGFRSRLRSLGDALVRIHAPESLALDIDTPTQLAHARALGVIDADMPAK